MEMKLNLAPIKLAKQLRCISMRREKDSARPDLHYGLQGAEY